MASLSASRPLDVVAERRSPADRPLRLGVISSQAFSIGNFRGPLIRQLVSRGVQVFALAPDHDEGSRAVMRTLGAEPVDFSLSRAGLNPLRDLRDALGLYRGLERLELDVTLGYFIKPVIYGTLAAAWAGVPRRYALVPGLGYVFTTGDERAPLSRRMLQAVVARMYGAAFARCERVIFQNREDAEFFLGRGLIDARRVLLTNGTGVDLTQYPLTPLPPPPTTFVLVARLLREKGIREYVAAARRVSARHPNAVFLLVGGLDENPGSLTEAEVRGWVDEGLIEWAGQVQDVRPWLARASVYVLPSWREGVPRSTQEAMAMGRPVITTDAVGCRETVSEGVNGYLVPVRDPAGLAEAMERFVQDRALIERMGRESRRLAEERFDVNGTNARIVEALGV